jgi:hypothetical protein
MVALTSNPGGPKIVECLLSKSFARVMHAFGNAARRIRKLLEDNALAILHAAINTSGTKFRAALPHN